jgi:TRAP-type C4-dicarboxylate transport system substrate-binding protein
MTSNRCTEVGRAARGALTGAVAFIAALAWAGNGGAQTTLNLSSYSTTTAWSATVGLATWMKNVEAETEGRVKVRLLETSLGKPEAHFDLAYNGIADVTLGVLGYTPSRFQASLLASMPGIGATGEILAVTLWRMFQKHAALRAEFEGVKVLSLMSTSPQQVFTRNKAVKRIEDYEGLKIRVPGGLVGEAAGALGMTRVNQPATKAYELLSAGILDGVAFPKETIEQFNLLNVVRHVTLIPGGIGGAPLFLLMNKAKWEGLSKQDQEGVMRASGEKFASFYGGLWDKRDVKAIEQMRAAGIQVEEADADLLRVIEERFKQVERGWIEQVKRSRGIDGTELLRDFRAEAKKVAAGS